MLIFGNTYKILNKQLNGWVAVELLQPHVSGSLLGCNYRSECTRILAFIVESLYKLCFKQTKRFVTRSVKRTKANISLYAWLTIWASHFAWFNNLKSNYIDQIMLVAIANNKVICTLDEFNWKSGLYLATQCIPRLSRSLLGLHAVALWTARETSSSSLLDHWNLTDCVHQMSLLAVAGWTKARSRQCRCHRRRREDVDWNRSGHSIGDHFEPRPSGRSHFATIAKAPELRMYTLVKHTELGWICIKEMHKRYVGNRPDVKPVNY